MHVLGFTTDLNAILQFIITAGVLFLGLLYLAKATATRYLLVDGKFEGNKDCRLNNMMCNGPSSAGQTCYVCGKVSSKKCSGCKTIRYCSPACQTRHWNDDHKRKCKGLRFLGCLDPTPEDKKVGFEASSMRLRGICKELKQPQKVLFPYDAFVKLFNWESSGFPPCGLLNCGNSCFANVILQCLASTKPLVAFLLEQGHTKECRRNDWCFLCELQTHFQRVSRSSQPFSPINILSRLPSLGGNLGYGRQEDAHEFMRFAVDTMQSICLDEFGGGNSLDPRTQETTIIQHIFGGHLQSQVVCTKCDKVSYRYENMMDLTVEIQGDAVCLEDCLNQFTAKEWLDGDNKYKCDGCNDYVRAWKRLTVHHPPNVLTIALKRFQSGRFGKLNKRVVFPESLDLNPFISNVKDGVNLYKLYAVVVHVDMLNASYFGHYICYTKDFRGDWYRIDDCKVMKVNLDEVLAQGAYMLLYCRTYPCQPFVKLLEQNEPLDCRDEETEMLTEASDALGSIHSSSDEDHYSSGDAVFENIPLSTSEDMEINEVDKVKHDSFGECERVVGARSLFVSFNQSENSADRALESSSNNGEQQLLSGVHLQHNVSTSMKESWSVGNQYSVGRLQDQNGNTDDVEKIWSVKSLPQNADAPGCSLLPPARSDEPVLVDKLLDAQKGPTKSPINDKFSGKSMQSNPVARAKPLFSPGFLDKPARNKSVFKPEARPNPLEVDCSCHAMRQPVARDSDISCNGALDDEGGTCRKNDRNSSLVSSKDGFTIQKICDASSRSSHEEVSMAPCGCACMVEDAAFRNCECQTFMDNVYTNRDTSSELVMDSGAEKGLRRNDKMEVRDTEAVGGCNNGSWSNCEKTKGMFC